MSGQPPRPPRGFTLIELMIVVAIVGVLAAIAIPNFLRYQLRAKFGELPSQVSALFTSEESLRQSERLVPGSSVTGQYHALSPTPAGATLGSSKVRWAAADLAQAANIDWLVEGNTYGQYAASVVNGALSIGASSDIDADGVPSCVALYRPSGADTAAALTAPCATATTGAATDPLGSVVAKTGGDVF